MSKERPWTEEEESLLRENYPSTSVRALSEMLGRSIPSVDGKVRRLGLAKQDTAHVVGGAREGYRNPFELMPREDALKLDKIDLLRVNWSLFEMYRRELNNPSLSKAQRHRLMNALSNHTSIINSVMKGSEDQLGDEDDLKARFISLNLGDGRRTYGARRIRLMRQPKYRPRRTRVMVEGSDDEAE
ncbi:MAG: hypothetical protein ABIJ47_03700 [Candidatus Bathyarchaeota archaeon]